MRGSKRGGRAGVVVLAGVVPLLAPGPAAALDCGSLPAADVVICEDLLWGSSAEVHGGAFDGTGFQVNGWESYLHYYLPEEVWSGYVEWTVEGMTEDTLVGDNVFMLQLFDTGGHWGSTYGLEVRTYGDFFAGTWDFGTFKLKYWTPEAVHETRIDNPGWDGGAHRFRLDFGTVGRVTRDGVTLIELPWDFPAWFALNLVLPSHEWTGTDGGNYAAAIGSEIRDLVLVGWGEDGEGGGDDDDDDTGTVDGLVPVDDASVNVYEPDSVVSNVDDLACESPSTPAEVSFLKFDTSSIPGTVTRADLVLRTLSGGSSGGSSVSVYPVADDSWQEETMTWNTRPALGAAPVGSTGTTAPSLTYAVDVTAALGSGPLVSLALVGGTDGSHFASKEEAGGAHAPLLEVEYEGTPPGDDDTTPPGDDDSTPPVGDDDSTSPTDDDAAGDDDTTGPSGDADGLTPVGCGSCDGSGPAGSPPWGMTASLVLGLASRARRRAR